MNPVPSSTLIEAAPNAPAPVARTSAQGRSATLAPPIGTAPAAIVVELPMPSRKHQPLRGRHVAGATALVVVALLITGLFVGLPLAVAAHAVFHSVAANLIIAAAILLEAFAVVVFLIVRTRGRSSAPHTA